MSYVLQQKRHTYIKYDVNRLANVCLLKSVSGSIFLLSRRVSFHVTSVMWNYTYMTVSHRTRNFISEKKRMCIDHTWTFLLFYLRELKSVAVKRTFLLQNAECNPDCNSIFFPLLLLRWKLLSDFVFGKMSSSSYGCLLQKHKPIIYNMS